MKATVDHKDQLDIQASLQGNEEAYARLVRRYEARVAAQMRHFTRERHEREELVQDVFVEAYLSLSAFKGRAPFLHWLRKIATRTGYRHWKRRDRERQMRAALIEHDPPVPANPEDQTPSEAAESLHRLLELLSPRDRLVLSLYYFEECNTKEIAKLTGWTRTLVKVRMYRARKKLKTFLEEASYEE